MKLGNELAGLTDKVKKTEQKRETALKAEARRKDSLARAKHLRLCKAQAKTLIADIFYNLDNRLKAEAKLGRTSLDVFKHHIKVPGIFSAHETMFSETARLVVDALQKYADENDIVLDNDCYYDSTNEKWNPDLDRPNYWEYKSVLTLEIYKLKWK